MPIKKKTTDHSCLKPTEFFLMLQQDSYSIVRCLTVISNEILRKLVLVINQEVLPINDVPVLTGQT